VVTASAKSLEEPPPDGGLGGGGGVVPPPPPEPYDHVMPSTCQSSPEVERPCIPAVMEPEVPDATVICAVTTLPPGASSGLIQNTAPSVTSMPLSAVQPSQSMPMELSAPAASPSVRPAESHESYCAKPSAALFATAQKAGLVPPVLAPNGVATW